MDEWKLWDYAGARVPLIKKHERSQIAGNARGHKSTSACSSESVVLRKLCNNYADAPVSIFLKSARTFPASTAINTYVTATNSESSVRKNTLCHTSEGHTDSWKLWDYAGAHVSIDKEA